MNQLKFKNKNLNEQFIYLIPKEIFIEYFDRYNLNYSIINDNILSKKNKNLINHHNSKKKLLNEYMDKNFKISSENDIINMEKYNIKNNKDLPYIITKNNSEKIYYYDEYILSNEIIMELLNIDKKIFPKFEYYSKDEYIFLFHPMKNETIIEVGKLNDQNIFKIKFLIESSKDYESIIHMLQTKTFSQFISSSFIFSNFNNNSNDNYSPFFDEQNNIIGNGYRLGKGFNNFSDCYFNPMFINIIYLIIYFKFFNINNNEKYYLINTEWINNFKNRYMFEDTKKEIENNKNPNFSIIINKEQKDKNLLKKLICVLISNMPEHNKKFNNIIFNMENCPSEPDCDFKIDYKNGKKFYFYKNFFILDEEIYNKIFILDENQSEEMKIKKNYCQCFNEEGYIFILLENYITHIDKIVFEVGVLDEGKKFNIKYLLLFNSENGFKHHLGNMKNIGFKNYFENLVFNKQSYITLESNNILDYGGYIYKY